MDALLEAGVELNDIEVADGYMTITTDPTVLDDAKVVIDQLIPGVKYEVFEDRMVANDTVSLEGEDKVLFKRLVTLLDDVDDVQQVYHNVDNLDD